MKIKIILTFSFLLFQAAIQTAFAQDYCNKNGEVLTTYFAPRLGAEGQEVQNYQNGIQTIFKKLQIGDKLEILTAHDAGVVKSFSACFPGCPPQGIMDQFLGLGGSCKATLAKKDQIDFKRKFVSNARRTMEDARDGSLGYLNILKVLAVINAHANSAEVDSKNTYLVSTMFNNTDINRSSVNGFFVNAVQNQDMLDAFPKLQVLGMSLNPDLIEMWTDLYAVNSQTFDYK
mgnify:CR=1 FL=1|jgi:hypothetical protein